MEVILEDPEAGRKRCMITFAIGLAASEENLVLVAKYDHAAVANMWRVVFQRIRVDGRIGDQSIRSKEVLPKGMSTENKLLK